MTVRDESEAERELREEEEDEEQRLREVRRNLEARLHLITSPSYRFATQEGTTEDAHQDARTSIFQFTDSGHPDTPRTILRVRKGAAELIEQSRYPAVREGDGVPAYSIHAHVYPASAVDPDVEKLFTEGEMANILWKVGIDEVVIHTTRHSELNLGGILGELAELGKRKLHIFGGAIPSGVKNAHSEHSRMHAEFDAVISLEENQRYGFIMIAPEHPMFAIVDEHGDHKGVGGPGFLTVLFNIFGERSNQSDILSYLTRQWMKGSKLYELLAYSQASLNKLSRDDTIALFHKVYDNIDVNSTAAMYTKQSAKNRVTMAFDRYRLTVRKYAETLRFLEGKERPDDETIAQRAEAVFEALAANPLLSGVRVVYDTLKIVTKPLRSDSYWKGTKRLIITIPLFYKGNDNELRIHEFHPTYGITSLPYKDDYIFDDGKFCLGSLSQHIDTNILMGEWNMAALLILRALLGQGDFRRQLKHYKSVGGEET